MTTYAIELTQNNMPLIAMLNHGVSPDIPKENAWFVFQIRDDGTLDRSRILIDERFFAEFTSPFSTRIQRLEKREGWEKNVDFLRKL